MNKTLTGELRSITPQIRINKITLYVMKTIDSKVSALIVDQLSKV